MGLTYAARNTYYGSYLDCLGYPHRKRPKTAFRQVESVVLLTP